MTTIFCEGDFFTFDEASDEYKDFNSEDLENFKTMIKLAKDYNEKSKIYVSE